MKYLLDGESTLRLSFRCIQASDFNLWLAFFHSPVAHLHWKAPQEDPIDACRNWYKRQDERYTSDLGGMNVLIERVSGKLVGHCGLLVQEVDGKSELEIGYSLLPDYWNRGYATEAAKKCRDFAFAHNLTESLISIISVSNHPSQRVAQRNGMAIDKETIYKENKVFIYRIIRDQWEALGSG